MVEGLVGAGTTVFFEASSVLGFLPVRLTDFSRCKGRMTDLADADSAEAASRDLIVETVRDLATLRVFTLPSFSSWCARLVSMQ